MTLKQLLDAVKAQVESIYAAPDPDEDIIITRRYLPVSDLSKVPEMHIDIVPGSATFDLVNRSQFDREQLVAISFRQKLPANCNPEVEGANYWLDGRLLLVGLAVQSFSAGNFNAAAKAIGASMIEVRHDLFDPRALREQKLFSSLLVLTFLNIE